MTAISKAEEYNLIPNGLVVERYEGGWQGGGIDPVKEFLAHVNQRYLTKRTQVISSGEESKKDILEHTAYKQRCAAAIKTKSSDSTKDVIEAKHNLECYKHLSHRLSNWSCLDPPPMRKFWHHLFFETVI